MSRRRTVSIDELPDSARRTVQQRFGVVALGEGSVLLDAGNGQRRRKRQDLEHPQQVALFAWADAADIRARWPELEVLYAIPNWFGFKTKRQGARAKAEGRRKGMLDVCLPVPRRSAEGTVFGACYLEMKDVTGAVREAQHVWIQKLRARGNFADVATSADAAKALLLYYLSLPKP
jgi:hypothetical protein